MAKRGRPLIELKKDEFEKLCSLHCTLEEIAGWFKCSEDTVERWCKRTYCVNFAEIYKKNASSGKISLRREMFRVALSGNVGMLIWLSKQHLGMSDKVEEKTEVKAEVTQIEYVANWGNGTSIDSKESDKN